MGRATSSEKKTAHHSCTSQPHHLLGAPISSSIQHPSPLSPCLSFGASETSTGQNESVYIIAAAALCVPLWIHRNHNSALHPFEEWLCVCSIHVRFVNDAALRLEATARPHVLEGVEEFIPTWLCNKSRKHARLGREVGTRKGLVPISQPTSVPNNQLRAT